MTRDTSTTHFPAIGQPAMGSFTRHRVQLDGPPDWPARCRTVALFPQWLVQRPNAWFAFWLIATPLVFFTDQWTPAALQLLPALFFWWMLAVALSARARHDQLLLTVLVAVATVCEVVASLVLHWYTYRLRNIPPWVPPGHGIVFLTAMLTMEQPWAIKHATLLRNLVTASALAYACAGIASRHHDLTGAAATVVFMVWLWAVGTEKARFYTALWAWVCFLELSGVWLGAWHWSGSMPLTGLSEGNPPSGIVGAYGIFDLTAFGIATAITRQAQAKAHPSRWPRITRRWHLGSTRPAGDR
jgi:hypothetical protein